MKEKIITFYQILEPYHHVCTTLPSVVKRCEKDLNLQDHHILGQYWQGTLRSKTLNKGEK